jgi:hypothetical protein
LFQGPLRRIFGQTPFPASNPTIEDKTRAFKVKWSSVDGALVGKAIELAENWTESMAGYWQRTTGATVSDAEYARLYQRALDTVADPWLRSMAK